MGSACWGRTCVGEVTEWVSQWVIQRVREVTCYGGVLVMLSGWAVSCVSHPVGVDCNLRGVQANPEPCNSNSNSEL